VIVTEAHAVAVLIKYAGLPVVESERAEVAEACGFLQMRIHKAMGAGEQHSVESWIIELRRRMEVAVETVLDVLDEIEFKPSRTTVDVQVGGDRL
jgi:hypothetical protein